MAEEGELSRLREENEQLKQRVARLEQERGGAATAFLHSILEAVPAQILRLDPDLRIVYINRLAEGFRLDDVVGASVREFIAEEDVPHALAVIREVQATGRRGKYSVRGLSDFGEISVYDTYVSPIAEDDGRVGVCLVAYDVTEDRERARALQESEQMLRLAVRATGLGLFSHDLVHDTARWDEATLAIFRRTEAVRPSDLAAWVHPLERERVLGEARTLLDRDAFHVTQLRILRGDGSEGWVTAAGAVIHDASGRAVRIIGGVHDVTEERRVHDQLLRSQKMNAMGNLTAGIAHNFNNLLMAILPALEAALRDVPPSRRPMIAEASDAARRATELVRQLMTFAGQRRSPMSSQDLGHVAERVVGMCQRTFDRHIDLRLEGRDVPLVRGDETALEQVLLNLLLNARDAVLETGASAPRIVVTLAEASAADVASRPELAASQRWVVMTVSDEGPGMTEEVVGRAFEPFFSTKDVGKGTGLGLATAYATIREHGGLIECHSRLGEGTRFVVHLPVAETPSRPASRSTAPPEPGEGIRVLVVDDERAIRVVVQHMLEEAGFAVRVASSAEEAVATLGRDAEVDVVLLDRSMPGAPGSRLLPELRRLCPTAKVLYFTGQQVARGEAEAVDGVVHKPIEAAALVAALRRVVVPRRTAPPRFDANGFTASDEER